MVSSLHHTSKVHRPNGWLPGSRSVLLALTVFAGGCQSLVGIHPGRDGAPGPDGAVSIETKDASPRPQTGDGAAADARVSGRSDGGGGGTGTAIPGSGGSAGPSGGTPPDGGGGIASGGSGAPSGGVVDAGGGSTAGEPPRDAAVVDAASGPSDATTGPVPCPTDARPARPLLQGTAFQYSAGPNGATSAGMGVCGFPSDRLPVAPAHFYAAIDTTLMGNAAALCGVCLRATAAGKAVEVTVIDALAPNLGNATGYTLAFDRPALSTLSAAPLNIVVDFEFVPCTDPGTIQVKFASSMDASVLLMGSRNQLQSVQISSAGGPFQNMKRQMHNYWFPPMNISGAAGRVTLRVTDVLGNVLTLPNLVVDVPLVDTRLQFPAPLCP